jgi:hypothetical protein
VEDAEGLVDLPGHRKPQDHALGGELCGLDTEQARHRVLVDGVEVDRGERTLGHPP